LTERLKHFSEKKNNLNQTSSKKGRCQCDQSEGAEVSRV
jgi:hypothetical protein